MNTLDIVITVGGALAAVFKWTFENSKKLKWEQNRFLLEELDKFQSLESTTVMEKLLDWNKASVTISGETIRYNDKDLYEAFSTHDVKHTFTRSEVLMRQVFDDYFDGLTRLFIMAETGLIDKNNLKKFLSYWLEIINGQRSAKSMELRIQIKNYLSFYSYDTLIKNLYE
jgi:hypothetical protein